MEDLPEPEPGSEAKLLTVEIEPPSLCEAAAAFCESVTTFNKALYTDKRQPGGRWAPAFPEPSLAKQEEYVERMIARDKELNLG